MSSTTAAQPPPASSPDETFLGWRYVEQPQADGTVRTVTIPLTLEDLLHPQEGDKVAHAEPHERRGTYLYDIFQFQVADQPGTVVLKDVRIDWDHPDIKPHSPDLTVIAGVHERKAWSTFPVGVEGVRPSLILEITSPETRKIDLIDKLAEYDQVEVPLYIIVESDTARTPMRLHGYERINGRFQPLAPDERGYLWLAPVKVWLGVVENEAVCFDQQGEPIGNFGTQRAARLAAEQQAATEAAARAAAERQVVAEAAARASAEARVRELEARLRQRGGKDEPPPA